MCDISRKSCFDPISLSHEAGTESPSLLTGSDLADTDVQDAELGSPIEERLNPPTEAFQDYRLDDDGTPDPRVRLEAPSRLTRLS
jgi:hypothetical protein